VIYYTHEKINISFYKIVVLNLPLNFQFHAPSRPTNRPKYSLYSLDADRCMKKFNRYTKHDIGLQYENPKYSKVKVPKSMTLDGRNATLAEMK